MIRTKKPDGTKWKPSGNDGFRVIWYIDEGGTLGIDSDKPGTGMTHGNWNQQGDSVKTTWAASSFGGQIVFEGKISRRGDSTVGQLNTINNLKRNKSFLELPCYQEIDLIHDFV